MCIWLKMGWLCGKNMHLHVHLLVCLEVFTISRLATLRNTPGASSDLLYLLGNMAGLLGTSPPSDDSTASSMMGLMGKCIVLCCQCN